jgi:septal ring factor EnvC (AmiA/AmiB activator)
MTTTPTTADLRAAAASFAALGHAAAAVIDALDSENDARARLAAIERDIAAKSREADSASVTLAKLTADVATKRNQLDAVAAELATTQERARSERAKLDAAKVERERFLASVNAAR